MCLNILGYDIQELARVGSWHLNLLSQESPLCCFLVHRDFGIRADYKHTRVSILQTLQEHKHNLRNFWMTHPKCTCKIFYPMDQLLNHLFSFPENKRK
jgi:hypothetical protein